MPLAVPWLLAAWADAEVVAHHQVITIMAVEAVRIHTLDVHNHQRTTVQVVTISRLAMMALKSDLDLCHRSMMLMELRMVDNKSLLELSLLRLWIWDTRVCQLVRRLRWMPRMGIEVLGIHRQDLEGMGMRGIVIRMCREW